MPTKLLALGLIAWGVLTPLPAEDLQSIHNFHLNVPLTQTLTVQLVGRVWTWDNLSGYNQSRFGPQFQWAVKRRVTALAGYDWNYMNRRKGDPYGQHRFLLGTQIRAFEGERTQVDVRLLAERFIPGVSPSYYRFRQRGTVYFRAGHWIPYVAGEAIWQQDVWFGRYIGGVQRRLSENLLVGTGYEYRQTASGVSAHVLTTLVEFKTPRHGMRSR